MGYLIITLAQILITMSFIGLVNLFTFGTFSVNLPYLITFLRAYTPMLSAQYKILMICAGIVYFLEFAGFLTILGREYRSRLNRNTYSKGTAHFATRKEMLKQGLFNDRASLEGTNSVLLAQSNEAQLYEEGMDSWKYKNPGKYIISYDFDKTPSHLMLVSSTRGGKGTGTIISTLLTWKDSIICFDPKGENYQKTAGYRSRFSKIIRIAPSRPEFSHFNPLDFLRPGAGLMNDANNIAYILLPKNPQESQPYFSDNGRTIIALGIMYVIFFEKTKTLAEAYRVLTSMEDQKLFSMMQKRFQSVTSPDMIIQETLTKCAQDAASFANLPPVTLGGCKSAATTALAIFALPTVKMITANSDFTIEELVSGDRPVSVYLTVTTDEVKSTAALTRILFSVINRNLMREWSQDSRKRKILMLIDEFSQLGRFGEIEDTLSIAAGYGICYILAIQSLAQLQQIYGRDGAKVFCDNMIVSLLKIQDPESAKFFSDILGTQTIVLTKASKSGKQTRMGSESYSVNSSETARQLMTPSEISSKPGDEILIIIPSRAPYLAKRILYYEEDIFKKRAGIEFSYENPEFSFPSPHLSLASELLPASAPIATDITKPAAPDTSEGDSNDTFFNQSLEVFTQNPELLEEAVSELEGIEEETDTSTEDVSQQHGDEEEDIV